MITLQYVISSILLIFPFIIAGIIEAAYDQLFLKRGKVLDLSVATGTGGAVAFTVDNTFRSVFQFDNGGVRQVIGSENPLVFYATDPTVTPTSIGDYKNKLEAKFTDSLNFNLFLEGTNIGGSYNFNTQGRRMYLYNQNILYQYNYGEWLGVIFAAVFGICVLRILYKEVTISNLVQATRKFRIGLFGVDTSLEGGRGFTVIKALKGLLNLLGWIVSFFVFPTSNLMFFISFLVISVTFCVSFAIAISTFEKAEEGFTVQDKAICGASFIGVFVLFIAFRYFSDRRDPERNNLSGDKSLIRSGEAATSAAIRGGPTSGADASAIARSLAT